MIRPLELDLSAGSVVQLPFDRPVYLTLREAGDMGPSGATRQDRRDELLQEKGIDPRRYATVTQVHSREVVILRAGASVPAGTEADGLLTDDPGRVLGVTVADCMPIFLSAPRVGAFGALHSGWRGTGILGVALELLRSRFGAEPSEVSVALGPAIGSCCYRVEEERAALFADQWGDRSVVRRDDGPYLDLQQANLEILEREGVESVFVSDRCTSCSPELGSFRRQGAAHFTRMMAFIRGDTETNAGI